MIATVKVLIDKPWLVYNELRMLLTTPFAKTYLFYKGVKIKPPFKLYGPPSIMRHRQSQIVIGKNFENRNYFLSNPLCVHHSTVLATLKSNAKIVIGRNVGISGSNIVASSKILIGDFTMIGSNCLIIDTDFHPLSVQNRRYSKTGVSSKPIKIGNNVFIGTRSIILKGVVIGNNSVIGAGSVVRQDIPANSIYVDNKIKKLK